jgi:hypothetical protein
MIKKIKLQWFTDAGHGWLKISREDAENLGILDLISGYSYVSPSGKYLYLEEDQDAVTAFGAITKQKREIQYKPFRNCAKYSTIRNYRHVIPHDDYKALLNEAIADNKIVFNVRIKS